MINQIVVNFVLSILMTTAIIICGEFSDIGDAKIDLLLKKLNKPPLKSIKSPTGDIIDCIHMKNHPIYDHPLFKNHTIQMKPSADPETWNNEFLNKDKKSIVTQLWTINGKCPKNSIPIKRTKREDILRINSIQRYGKKNLNSIPRTTPTNFPNNFTREYAQFKLIGNFHGAQAVINVWKPYVQTPVEFSLAQMWLVAGPNHQTNTIEFGWQVYKRRYGDDNPRFIIYWTADNYNRTGCYNLECPGFVLVSREFALGVSVSHVSTIDGQQYHIPTTIWKDHRTGNWWLKINYHIIVGYWPSKLFNHLQNGITEIQMGGEITNYKTGSQHTRTHMGSGRFAMDGYKKASYFRNIKIYDANNSWQPIPQPNIYNTQEHCYNVKYGKGIVWGDFFFYGGPGRNPYCV